MNILGLNIELDMVFLIATALVSVMTLYLSLMEMDLENSTIVQIIIKHKSHLVRQSIYSILIAFPFMNIVLLITLVYMIISNRIKLKTQKPKNYGPTYD